VILGEVGQKLEAVYEKFGVDKENNPSVKVLKVKKGEGGKPEYDVVDYEGEMEKAALVEFMTPHAR
jgi:hypothetical protein